MFSVTILGSIKFCVANDSAAAVAAAVTARGLM